MNLGTCPFLNAGHIPTQLAYAGFPFLFFHLLLIKEALVSLIMLCFALTVLTGLFIDSVRLFFLGLLLMAIKAFPRIVLPSLAAMVWWVIKQIRR